MTEEQEQNQQSYTAKDISVLEGLEPVRKRPGMYIGGTSVEGLHHLVWEVLDNSIDEAMADFANKITIELLPKNMVKITDNGRGIPIDVHAQTKKSALETVLTTLHAGGKFGGSGYKVSGGLHGVGVSVVNALSDYLEAEVHRNGKIYKQEYCRGKAKSKVAETGVAKDSGTVITFSPDPEIFEIIEFSLKAILERARQQAYLTRGIKISVMDARDKENPQKATFYFEGGINAFVQHLNKNKTSLVDPPIYTSRETDNVIVEVALSYTNDFNEHTYTFANNIATIEGGMHLTGFKTALTRAINDYAKKNDLLKGVDAGLTGDDAREGLTAIVSVKLPNPQFEGQTKGKLGNPEIKGIVESAVSAGLSQYFEEHPNDARKIVEKVALSARARLAARAARDTVIRKGALEGMTLPGKLADCSEKDASKSEIFIVEGDSAGGCFSGDTKIALADGRNLSFKDLIVENKKGKQNYCYTIKKNNEVGIEKILNPRITRKNATVIKIVLDNGKEIICTPNHEFMLRDGSYLEAEKLDPTMSLMPLRKKLSKIEHRITIAGYEMVLNPEIHKWIFTHILSDRHNVENGVYPEMLNCHKHHVDFNRSNNNPDNIVRMKCMDHIAHHANCAKQTLHTKETIEKCNKIKRTDWYRQKLSTKMKTLAPLLSERAKKQWSDPEYKKFMTSRFIEFYKSNVKYREKNRIMLDRAQKEYWSNELNRSKQSEKVRIFFENNSEIREEFSAMAKKQWKDTELLKWRKGKTKQQWTDDFRARRKIAYDRTYLNSSLTFAKRIVEKYGDLSLYDHSRTNLLKRNTNLLKLETLSNRFFNGKNERLLEAVKNYNHKIKSVEFLNRKVDVYDIEVPNTHNFALASGVFVHNSAKQGRERKFQAILPLKGKILNVERARLDRMLSSDEIKALIVAMGAGIGEELNVEKVRYHRIIIMTDADVDGSHIRTLLLTLFFRHFKEIIEKGYIYIAQPPLFMVTSGKEKFYAYSDNQKDERIKTIEAKNGRYSIQRYKGLGEMNPTQLWETTMNPETRKLMQVKIDDAELADETFSMLMGDEVPPRKRFIQTRAKTVSNLDI